MAMHASWCWAQVTVSMLSAMISRDWSENRIPDTRVRLFVLQGAGTIPSFPIVIASETPTVLYCQPRKPSFCTDSLMAFPRSSTKCLSVKVGVTCNRIVYLRCILEFVNTCLNTKWESRKMVLLARIPFPPDRSNSNMRTVLHRLFVRYPCCVQHRLDLQVSIIIS